MAAGWATPDDIRRASSPEEAAKALDWQSEQRELAAMRLAALEALRAPDETAAANYERWAPLLPDPPTPGTAR